VEAGLSRLSLVPAMFKTIPITCPPSEAGVSFVEDKGAKLYDCFTPSVGDIPRRSLPFPLFRLPLRARLLQWL
jgi:hypothetical protein